MSIRIIRKSLINQGQERKRNLEREQDEIKKENQQRRQEIDQLKEMINTKKDEAEREKKYLKEALEEQEQLKNQLRFVLFYGGGALSQVSA